MLKGQNAERERERGKKKGEEREHIANLGIKIQIVILVETIPLVSISRARYVTHFFIQ